MDQPLIEDPKPDDYLPNPYGDETVVQDDEAAVTEDVPA